MDKEFLYKPGKYLLIILLTLFVVFTYHFGIPYVRLKLYQNEQLDKLKTELINSKFCIIEYSVNGNKVILNNDFKPNDCKKIITFDEDFVYFPFRDLQIKGKYKLRSNESIEIIDCNYNPELFNSTFQLLIFPRQIFIMNDHFGLTGYKVN